MPGTDWDWKVRSHLCCQCWELHAVQFFCHFAGSWLSPWWQENLVQAQHPVLLDCDVLDVHSWHQLFVDRLFVHRLFMDRLLVDQLFVDRLLDRFPSADTRYSAVDGAGSMPQNVSRFPSQ